MGPRHRCRALILDQSHKLLLDYAGVAAELCDDGHHNLYHERRVRQFLQPVSLADAGGVLRRGPNVGLE
jgi:hypothetical protein